MASFALNEVLAEIDRQAAEFGVNPRLAKAIVVAENTESGSLKQKTVYRGDAVSHAGASGVMQVMPATARGLKAAGFLPATWEHDPSNLSSQVQAGLAAIKEKMGRVRNPEDLDEIASIYNGSSATHRAYREGRLGSIPVETKNYGQKLRRADMELGGTSGNNPSAFTANSSGGSSPAATTMQSGRTSSTRTTFTDPLQYDAFMSDIGAAVQPGGSYDLTKHTLQKTAEARDLLNAQLIETISQKATAAGEVAVAEASRDAAAAARKSQILRVTNLHPDVVGNQLEQAMSAINATDQSLEPMSQEIDARMSVGIFDNPIEWLINQVRLPGMVGQYNALAEKQNFAIKSFKRNSELASTQQTLSTAIDADVLTARGAATAKLRAAEAAAEAAKLGMDNASAQQRDALTMQQLTGQKLQLQGAALDKTKQTISERAGETEKQTALQLEKQEVDSVNKILTAAGGNPISTLRGLPTSKVEVLRSAATSGRFGKDFAESFDLIDNDGNINKIAETGGAAISHWVRGTAAAASTGLKEKMNAAIAMGGKFDAKKEKAANINQLQDKYSIEAASDMRTASPFNPLRLDYTAAAKIPALATNSVTAWVSKYGPDGSEPLMAKIDEKYLLDRFAKAVEAKRITEQRAAVEIANFYKVATAEQAAKTKYTLFGLNKPEKTYPIMLEGMKKPLDLGDPLQVERHLVTLVAREATRKMIMNSASSGGMMNANPLFLFGEN